MESFVFYRSFREAIAVMEDSDKLETLLAICDYALYGAEPSLSSPMSKAVFTMAKPNLDANQTKRKNGGKGGRPKKDSGVESKTSGFEKENLWFSETESNENENENETETVTETESGAGAETSTPARFTPPTVEEVSTFCQEEGINTNTVDPQRFVNYNEARGWKSGNTRITNWKALAREWARKGISNPRNDTQGPGAHEVESIAALQRFRDSLAEGGETG